MSTKQRTRKIRSIRFSLSVTFGAVLLSTWLLPTTTLAQTDQLSGRFVDQQQSALVGVPVTLMARSDTARKQYALTDTNGVFQFTGLSRQAYTLRAMYLGFQSFTRPVVIEQSVVDLGKLTLQDQARTLQGVTVIGQVISVR